MIRTLFIRLCELPTGDEPYTFPRVPAYIREKNENLYEPKSIAIGPYHHGRRHLQATEQKKMRFLRDLLNRATTIARLDELLGTLEEEARGYYRLEVLRETMGKLEKEARDHYRESIGLRSDDFVDMMVLDACFIIEFLLKLEDGHGKLPVEVGLWGMDFIDMDLLLFENQIPFFVIRELFQLIVGDGDSGVGAKNGKTLPIVTLLYKYMKISTADKLNETTRKPPDEIHHLLHLYYHWFVPDDKRSSKSSQSKGPCKPAYVIPCASELRNAGVTFKRKKAPRHMLDITFKNGVIEMPPIPILEITKPFFTNLVAFEQSIHQEKMRIGSFSLLMSSLIKTEKDVRILQSCNIIDNTPGNEQETVVFFNQLGAYAELSQVENYFSDLFAEVNCYRNRLWCKYRARVMREYNNNRWAIIPFIVGLILIPPTFLQTFFAIYPYFRPPK